MPGRLVLLGCCLAALGVGRGMLARAQSPTLDAGRFGGVPELRQNESSLGQMPGSGANVSNVAPDSSRPIIGGRAGTSMPIAPPSISDPGGGARSLGRESVAPTPSVPPAELPLFGPLSLPSEDEKGPPGGLTLDQAIARLLQENLDLRSRAYEIPQARADILQASLYANPIFYADAQLVPYGNYSRSRPGGQTQYDVNISHPIDYSGKRRARTEVGVRVKDVVEAQYQDAVRLEIQNLYESYIGVLLARESIRFANAALDGLDAVLETVRERHGEKIATEADVNGVLTQREFSAIGLEDSEQIYRSARLRLGTLLNMPPEEAEQLEPYGSLKVDAPRPPLGDELVRLALESRPDLISYRLGVHRSQTDVKLSLANRFADAYLLAQPYTFQNNAPSGLKSATSWALGLTVPLPLYNRNQGNIERARLNIDQSKVELAAQERRVVTEVKQAEKEYLFARSAVEKIEKVVRPAADQVLNVALLRWRSGEKDVLFYLSARRDYNEFVRQYLAAWVRYRRSMLRLNTVVGRCVQPS